MYSKFSPSLVIKKLRYYARFIVVCLLLDRIAIVKKLMEELTTLVGEYTQAFKPTDSAEWNVVLSEISTFLEVKEINVKFRLKRSYLQLILKEIH